jgi:hypothetical protein
MHVDDALCTSMLTLTSRVASVLLKHSVLGFVAALGALNNLQHSWWHSAVGLWCTWHGVRVNSPGRQSTPIEESQKFVLKPLRLLGWLKGTFAHF